MKQLKPNTIRRYSAQRLLRHLNRAQDHLASPLYRIDTMIRKYSAQDHAYYPHASLHDREAIIDAIRDTYRAAR